MKIRKKIVGVLLLTILMISGSSTIAFASISYDRDIYANGGYQDIGYEYVVSSDRGKNSCTSHGASSNSRWSARSSALINEDALSIWYWHGSGDYLYYYDSYHTGNAHLIMRPNTNVSNTYNIQGTWDGDR